MRFTVLGPVSVADADSAWALPRSQARAVLGFLLLHTGQVVSADLLVEALWAGAEPRTGRNQVQAAVSAIRQQLRALGEPNVLTTDAFGYRLSVARDQLDLLIFEDSVWQAHALIQDHPEQAVKALRTALALWQGPPLSGATGAYIESARRRLDDQRLSAIEDLVDQELALGNHQVVIGEFRPILDANPLRERLCHQLMLALYQTGRQAEALDLYHELRQQLGEDHGINPSLELRGLAEAILSDKPIPAVSRPRQTEPPVEAPAERIPRQLPPTVGHFCGRDRELAVLTEAAAPGSDAHATVVTGAPGVGKTALAVQWAHQVARRYPDGQVFVDLRGHLPAEALHAAAVMTKTLGSLSVPPDRIPADPVELADLYRLVMHDRRVLIVLDNAHSADQVRLMIPPNKQSALVVTSRNRLAGLAVSNAVVTVGLDVLDTEHALQLLRRMVGDLRINRELVESHQLVELCGSLPLALRLAAARLAAAPRRTVAGVTADLRVARLATLSVDQRTPSIRAVFATAYESVDASARGGFRLCGVCPGRTVSVELAAAVADTTPAVVRPVLDGLAMVNLVNQISDRRFALHDLLKMYAAERAQVDETADSRHSAVRRLIAWYLAVADSANRLLYPTRDRVTGIDAELPPAPFHTPLEAVEFLRTERLNLLPAARLIASHDSDATWQLAYLLVAFFEHVGYEDDGLEICQLGLAAARQGGDPTIVGLMQNVVGCAYIEVRQLDPALHHLEQATATFRRVQDHVGEALAQMNIGLVHLQSGRLEEAARACHQTLELATAGDHQWLVARALNNLGDIYRHAGQVQRALGYLQSSLVLRRRLNNRLGEAFTLDSIGAAHLADGRSDVALEHFNHSLRLSQDLGNQEHQAELAANIGAAHLAAGDHTAAVEWLSRASQELTALGHDHEAAVNLRMLASTLLDTGDTAAAARALEQAATIRQRTPDPHEQQQLDRLGADLQRPEPHA